MAEAVAVRMQETLAPAPLPLEGWSTYPALAGGPGGTLWVAWLERLEGADAIWLRQSDGAGPHGRDGGTRRRITMETAIKDGPALAWAGAHGLCCAWQFREQDRWRLAVTSHAEAPGREHTRLVDLDPGLRPSHPVLVSDGTRLLLACELHRPEGSQVVLLTLITPPSGAPDGEEWSAPLALSELHPVRDGAGEGAAAGGPGGPGGLGDLEGAYDPALAVTAGGEVWAAWIEARAARHDVWVSRAPFSRAHTPGAWQAPERVSGGPHLPAAPRLLAASEGERQAGRQAVWIAWSNYSGHPVDNGARPWADGPERRWERILFASRRRVHLRRWVTGRGWGPEQREPEPPPEGAPQPWQHAAPPNSHWPVLFPLTPPALPQGGSAGPLDPAHGGTTESVGLLCRRAVHTFRWTVEAHRLQAHPDGTVTWSDPLTLSGVDGSDADRSGGNMPVALAQGPDGRVYGAWQRHDRARTAPGFHFTPGASEIEVAPLPAAALPAAARRSVAVGAPGVAPPLLRRRPAPRGVEIEGQRFRLVFGNLHRHAECSSCGRDANGPAELHMRHAPDVNRNEFLAVTDHGEHLNPGEWREQCLLADFYTWDGHRVALPGIEWTSEAPWHPPAHGHKNLILSRSDLPFVDCWMPHADHPRRLWAWLAEHDPQAVTIPHHTMRGKAPTLWEQDDRRFQPVVEIFQDSRGSAEWLGAPAATSAERVQGLPLDPRGSVRRALDRGLRLGFIASSDHGGVALGGLYVRELSRAGVLEALRARRCFATSGDRLLLDFRVDGVFQGGELTLTERPGGRENQARPLTVTLRAEVLRPVQRVVLVRDGEELATVVPDPEARLVEHAWETEGPFVGTSYFYVRLEGADGELAWSSPVWVTRDWGES